MKYSFNLTKEESMGLIEILELFRKEDEDEATYQLRHNIKTQFQTQFDEIENKEPVTKEDVLKNAATVMGPSFCDTCD